MMPNNIAYSTVSMPTMAYALQAAIHRNKHVHKGDHRHKKPMFSQEVMIMLRPVNISHNVVHFSQISLFIVSFCHCVGLSIEISSCLINPITQQHSFIVGANQLAAAPFKFHSLSFLCMFVLLLHARLPSSTQSLHFLQLHHFISLISLAVSAESSSISTTTSVYMEAFILMLFRVKRHQSQITLSATDFMKKLLSSVIFYLDSIHLSILTVKKAVGQTE